MQVVQLRKLVELDISHNLIVNDASMPAGLSSMVSLCALDLSSNSLRGVPAPVTGLTNLQVVNVSANTLRGWPSEISALQVRCSPEWCGALTTACRAACCCVPLAATDASASGVQGSSHSGDCSRLPLLLLSSCCCEQLLSSALLPPTLAHPPPAALPRSLCACCAAA